MSGAEPGSGFEPVAVVRTICREEQARLAGRCVLRPPPLPAGERRADGAQRGAFEALVRALVGSVERIGGRSLAVVDVQSVWRRGRARVGLTLTLRPLTAGGTLVRTLGPLRRAAAHLEGEVVVSGGACARVGVTLSLRAAGGEVASRLGWSPLVVIAEDNPVNNMVLRLLLERAGCRTVPCVDGREVIDTDLRLSVDLFLLDIAMPVMDGWECLARLRAAERAAGAPRRPVLIYSADMSLLDGARLASAGADGWLAK
ncbi:MAG TPA: response regulator, partial [Myxococcota bacterium]|nr:response regulator [Myxococcota bacterium]